MNRTTHFMNGVAAGAIGLVAVLTPVVDHPVAEPASLGEQYFPSTS